MKTYLTNMIIIMVIGTFLIGCSSKNDKSEQNKDQTVTEQADQFDEKTSNIIREISEFECKLLMLYAEENRKDDNRTVNEEILRLRAEKLKLIDLVLQNNPDSIRLQAFHKELLALSEAEDYCQGIKKLKIQRENVNKEGVPDKPLKIREDADELAAINCRILQTRKSIQEGAGNKDSERELKKLIDEKRKMFDRIVLIYGPNIIKDNFFRELVLEAQEKKCNHRQAVTGMKRPDPSEL